MRSDSLFRVILFTFLYSIIFAGKLSAQIGSPQLPNVISWKDNENIILSQFKERKQSFFEYNIKKQTMKEIDYKPVKATPPMVMVKDDGLYYVDNVNGIEKRLTNIKAFEQNPTLSPDNKHVAFTRGNNLCSIEIETGKETKYTTDGSELILNGWASWVYFEEIFGRGGRYRAFWWSPDSKKLAFYRFDDTKVPMFPIYNGSGQHGSITRTRYPKAGDINPEARLGFVKVGGDDIVWADFNPDDDQYFGTPYWSSNSETVMVQWMDRDQKNLVLYGVNSTDGSKKSIYKEHQKTWIDWISDMKFGKNGFYFVRDFELWEQIYYQSYDGSVLDRLTEGKNWGIKILDFDEDRSYINFSARREASVRNDIYRVTWGKQGKKIDRVSSGEYNYANPLFSPDGKYVVASCSNTATPFRLVLLSAEKRGVVKQGELRVIADSNTGEFNKMNLPVREMIYITTPDGFKLPGTITYPLNFDKSKKYPVIIDIYGGPNHSNVMDIWKMPGSLTRQSSQESNTDWLKTEVIQVSLDNRASGHCGKEGMNFIHRNLGHYELQDYITWAKYLISLPYVNPEKIGITGFSYGGTMTVLALTEGSDYFKFGVAGAGVYDWRLYDTHYTERYMDHPKDNRDGYDSSAVNNMVSKYKGGNGSLLFLTHGTGDDNVHFQNTLQLIDALQKAGKQFELMIYPNGMHGYGSYQGAHYNEAVNAFWRKTLLNRN